MAEPSTSPRSRVLQGLISLAFAAVLVGMTTLVRMALNPQLGALSPFMLYVAAVLVAGLARGPFCGLLVMAGGGAAGFQLFLNGGDSPPAGSWMALVVFWLVSALVLATANELRVQLKVAMDRLSAVLQRNGRSSV